MLSKSSSSIAAQAAISAMEGGGSDGEEGEVASLDGKPFFLLC